MRCTFYVDGDLLEPWEEQLDAAPIVGSQLARYGVRFVVTRASMSQLPTSGESEMTIWMAPIER